MVNRYRGQVEIEIGGTARVLRLSTNIAVQLESHFGGKSITEIFQDPGFTEIRAILYFGLKHTERGLTIEQVGDWIDDSDLEYIGSRIGACFEAWLGKVEETPEKKLPELPPVPEPTGSIGGSASQPLTKSV